LGSGELTDNYRRQSTGLGLGLRLGFVLWLGLALEQAVSGIG